MICNGSDVSKTTQPSFIHRNTDLTMINGWKYLYEHSRNQLRSCSAPGGKKAENSSTETGRKSHFDFPASTSPPNKSAELRARRDGPRGLWLLTQGEAKGGACLQSHSVFRELSEELVPVSPHVEDWRNQWTLHPSGLQKTRKSNRWFVTANTAQHNWEKSHNLRVLP